MKTWIFQSNPSKFDLLADWSDGKITRWSANQLRHQMEPGDSVYFRVSGKRAGLYGRGTILLAPYKSGDVYGDWKVDVRYEELIKPPLLRGQTDHHPVLGSFLPLRGQQMTNFLVPDEVARAIAETATSTYPAFRPPSRVSLSLLTSREAVLSAIDEFDSLGRERFLNLYGYGQSRGYTLVHQNREYDSKAIAGVALKYQVGSALESAEFSGGDQTVKRKLESLGFTVRGSRPPTWVRDELILALDLYVRFGWLDDLHPEVQELSRVLNSLPLHPEWRYAPRFRNPNGVCMKLANFQALDPLYKGTGLADVSVGDRQIWEEFHNNTDLLKEIASSIRESSVSEGFNFQEDDEDEALEGRILTRVHRSRERNRVLVGRRKQQRRAETGGYLTCEVCEFDFAAVYGVRGDDFAECHHKVPLAETGVRKTRLSDLAVLCSNCHRMIHVRKPMLSIDELRDLVRNQ